MFFDSKRLLWQRRWCDKAWAVTLVTLISCRRSVAVPAQVDRVSRKAAMESMIGVAGISLRALTMAGA
jgi:hypothetical protein